MFWTCIGILLSLGYIAKAGIPITLMIRQKPLKFAKKGLPSCMRAGPTEFGNQAIIAH
jgi:hypothetical protein